MIKQGHHSQHIKAEMQNITLKSSFKYIQYNVNVQAYGVSIVTYGVIVNISNYLSHKCSQH